MTTKTLWNVHIALNFLGILGIIFKVPLLPYAPIWLGIQLIVIYLIYKHPWEI